jgi:hypothetical protein
MKTKRVFSLASLFLAGAAVCGCQNTNQTAPIRQSPWQTSQGRMMQSGTQPGMMTQTGTTNPYGTVTQNGTVGTQQYQTGGVPSYTTTGSTGGMPSTGLNGVTPSGGFGAPSNTTYPGSPNTTKYGPTTEYQQGSYSPSMGGAGMGAMNVTQTQCPPGSCPTDGLGQVPPPPTNTLQQGPYTR